MANRRGSKRKSEARSRNYTIRFNPSKFEKLKAIASGNTISCVIHEAIDQYLELFDAREKAA